MTTQDDLFAFSEADNWFRRNAKLLDQQSLENDIPLRLAALYVLQPSTVLEIGAANGYRLQAFHQRYGCSTKGIDLSPAAIADGRARFPDVELQLARADDLPFEHGFDLVIVNFVLHWVDRRTLIRCIAEIDRVTSDGGYLIIGDFLPDNFVRRPYHHVSDQALFTYKQNYAALLLASGIYRPVALLTHDHSSRELTADVPADDRAGTWLLRKDLTGVYAASSH